MRFAAKRPRRNRRIDNRLERLEPRHLLAAAPLISEFMANNRSTLQDEDGDRSDWIELFNAGDESVNLKGYSLTDDARKTSTWRFPEVPLNPGEHLIVFASGKDRGEPGGELHTNFRLSNNGEYLALLQPGGQTVVQEFAPGYPAQIADVAYGASADLATTTLIAAGATARYRIPTDDSLAGQWMDTDFNDGGWNVGQMPLGYETGAAEMPPMVRTITTLKPLGYWRFEEFSGTTAVNEGTLGESLNGTYVGDPKMAVAGPGRDDPRFGFVMANVASNFSTDDAVTTGKSVLSDLSEFTMMGMIRPTSLRGTRIGLFGQNDAIEFGFTNRSAMQLWTAGGGSLDVAYPFSRNEWHHVAVVGDGSELRVYFDGELSATGGEPTDNYGASAFGFNIGGGGIFDAEGNHFRGDMDEVAVFDKALSESEIAALFDSTAGGEEGEAPVAIKDAIVTDLQAEMLGTGSTAYVRLPFEVADPAVFNQLLLRVKYDDGFVAYLNGAEIARANVGGDEDLLVPYDAVATFAHPDAAATQLETIDISDSRDALRAGPNVLAIRGLNVSADDPDFLIAAELEAGTITVDREAVGYLTTPTPGSSNVIASENLGPLVVVSQFSPRQPSGEDPITVSAEVIRTLEDLSSVELIYRVMFNDEITVPMVDDGSGGDLVAGDGIFTATIPGSIAQPGEMVRWYVRASDATGGTGRFPKFEFTTTQNQDPEYQGTVINDPSVSSQIPILYWFVENERRAGTRGGTRASLYYNGEFYDNVFARQRGGSTANSSQSRGKTNFKFDFKGQQFRFDPAYPRVEEFNLNSTASDKAYVRQNMAFEAYSVMGAPSSISFPMHVRRNNEFYGVFTFIEEPDQEMLTREGLDPDGALYKHVREFTSTNNSFKKNPKDGDFSDLDSFIRTVNGLRPADGSPNKELEDYLMDNVDLPAVMNYLVATVLVHQNDNPHKNHFMYRDTFGSGEWLFLPWDHDLTWGSNWVGTSYSDVIYADVDKITFGPVPGHDLSLIQPSHPFVNTEKYREWNNHWNRLMDAVLGQPRLREMYLRRLRTGMDLFLGPPGTTDSYYDRRFDEFANIMAEDARMDQEKWNLTWGEEQTMQEAIDIIKKEYLEVRRQHLYVTHSVDNVLTDPVDLISEFTTARYFVPGDDALGTTWTTTTFDDTTWLQGETGLGFENRPGRLDPLIRTRVQPDFLRNGTSVFARIPFTVDDPAAMKNLTLRMKYDDAFVAYINGTEVARANFDGQPSYKSNSTRSSRRPTDFQDFVISEHVGLLQPGENVLAIHGINRNLTDRDMLILPVLIDGIIPITEIAGIPHAQEGNPTLHFDATAYDVNPASGNQDEEFIKLDNPNDVAVDISTWRLTGGIEHTFRRGTVIPAGDSIYVSPDVRAFRARASGPSGGQGLFVQGNYQGHLSDFGETIQLVAPDGTLIDTLVTPSHPSDAQRWLRITEINYNPPSPDDDTEFIEVQNISSAATATTLDLTGVTLSDGPSQPFTFAPGTSLAPGQYLLIVKNQAAFQTAYPNVDASRIAGEFAGSLNNQGERIKLDDATGSTIVQLTYGDSDPWPVRADGAGATLVLVDPAGTTVDTYGKYYRWRGSTELGGSPGSDREAPLGIVINEVLSSTDGNLKDAIELANRSDQPIDIGGWYLSDSGQNLLKFEILQGTVLGAGEYVVFDESHFNPNPDAPGPDHFALDGSRGDDVWLVIPDGLGGVRSIVDDVHFGAAAAGESIGRYPDLQGRLAPMSRPTLGAPNATPRVGPVVISEVSNRPDVPSHETWLIDRDIVTNDLEYVEIHNPTPAAIDLTNWRIRGGVDFQFDPGTSIGAGQTILVLPFNPDSAASRRTRAAFRNHYGVDQSVVLVGGYQGRLGDRWDRVQLQRPDTVAPGGGPISHLVEDEILYDNLAPWPTGQSLGDSLARTSATDFGNSAASWKRLAPTPGSVDFVTQVMGDANEDGVFDQLDLDQVLQGRKYQTGAPATFGEGDFNGDGLFDRYDIVLALQSGFGLKANAATTPDQPGPEGEGAEAFDYLFERM